MNSKIKKPQSSEPKAVLCLIGSTGNGKSHTGSTLLQLPGAFVHGDGLVAHTNLTKRAHNAVLGLVVIDTPGFGDHRVSEDDITKILTGIAKEILEFDPDSPVMVNAFLLVQKANPRLSTLKSDIERMVAIFGTLALKSTIILIIQPVDKKPIGEFESSFTEMTSIMELYASVKAQPLFILWDNFKPSFEQFSQLKALQGKIPPYTHATFAQAQDDIKAKTEALLERMFGDRLRLIEAKYEQERQESMAEIQRLSEIMKNQDQQTEENKALFREQQQKMIDLENKLAEERKNTEVKTAQAFLDANNAMQNNFKALIEKMHQANIQMLQSQNEDRQERAKEAKAAEARFNALLAQKERESTELQRKLQQALDKPVEKKWFLNPCQIF